MITKTVKLTNEDGLHARSAALFVRMANRFSSEITLQAHGDSVNGKSIIGIMSLGAFYGEEISITASGTDEEKAVESLVELVENNFVVAN
ncbi:HPr family phosphocarrier protein [Anaerosphaera multitolerans]|uniref:Phosphocarrier protein HPr n=1 Tax=Anaerosphaera multitolerans TaxID=2487351 RepID=A0A437S7N4_9FIRM|nr:HPr family phosphocarrier protein [Anaerosphaera multitolerans]RVU55085.1 HPr family phosphocarrier protein [Anaerosphaera multitolerans]